MQQVPILLLMATYNPELETLPLIERIPFLKLVRHIQNAFACFQDITNYWIIVKPRVRKIHFGPGFIIRVRVITDPHQGIRIYIHTFTHHKIGTAIYRNYFPAEVSYRSLIFLGFKIIGILPYGLPVLDQPSSNCNLISSTSIFFLTEYPVVSGIIHWFQSILIIRIHGPVQFGHASSRVGGSIGLPFLSAEILN